MLGMFGLLGALLAGLVTDALIGNLAGKPDDDTADAPPDPAITPADSDTQANLLDWLGPDVAEGDQSGATPGDPELGPQSNDLDQASDPDLVLQGGDFKDILSGQGGNDSLLGGGGDDQLSGRDGDDLLQGGSGNDIADGGAGTDTLHGGTGDDLLRGGDGGDWLVGGAGADTLSGQLGDDSLFGGAGADTLLGGDGEDRLIGGDAADWLAGGLGRDHLIGDAGSDTLDGGAGNDRLDGREAINVFPEMDFLNGGEGDDIMMVGAGDYATGGDGADWFELSDLMQGDAIAQISDYDAAEDALVVVFDPALHANPQLSLETQDDTDDVVVLLDGVPLAMVQGGAGMTLDDLLLTPALAA